MKHRRPPAARSRDGGVFDRTPHAQTAARSLRAWCGAEQDVGQREGGRDACEKMWRTKVVSALSNQQRGQESSATLYAATLLPPHILLPQQACLPSLKFSPELGRPQRVRSRARPVLAARSRWPAPRPRGGCSPFSWSRSLPLWCEDGMGGDRHPGKSFSVNAGCMARASLHSGPLLQPHTTPATAVPATTTMWTTCQSAMHGPCPFNADERCSGCRHLAYGHSSSEWAALPWHEGQCRSGVGSARHGTIRTKIPSPPCMHLLHELFTPPQR